jgi:hypothetical protein
VRLVVIEGGIGEGKTALLTALGARGISVERENVGLRLLLEGGSDSGDAWLLRMEGGNDSCDAWLPVPPRPPPVRAWC